MTIRGVTNIHRASGFGGALFSSIVAYDIVVVAEGFTDVEQQAFQQAAWDFVNSLLATPPFDVLIAVISVFRLDVESVDSATTLTVACPAGTGVPGSPVNTDFLARFCSSGDSERSLTVDNQLVIDALDAEHPEWDAAVVIVNHPEHGGSGQAPIAVYSLGADQNTAIHEMGHAAFGLADEYDYLVSPAQPDPPNENRDYWYPPVEPGEPNVTTYADHNNFLKWGPLVDQATLAPTLLNPNCAQSSTEPSPVPEGTIGFFAGAYYHRCDIYRPEYNCMMRELPAPLCAVCSDHIDTTVRSVVEQECFVATGVYGDPNHPEVVVLRSWRDRGLRAGGLRRLAMRLLAAGYGLVGPALARRVRHRPRLARALRRGVFRPLTGVLR